MGSNQVKSDPVVSDTKYLLLYKLYPLFTVEEESTTPWGGGGIIRVGYYYYDF